MGVIVPEGEYQMSMIWTNALTSKEFTSTLGLANALSTHTPNEVADILYSALTTSDGPAAMCASLMMSAGWFFQGVSGFQATEDGPLLGAHLETLNGAGSDNDIPVNCAVLCTKQTASGGRKNRGRFFLPPFTTGLETDTNGQILSNVAPFIEGFLNELGGVLLDDDLVQVIHHSDGSAGTLITGYSVSPLLATQRKRMR